MKHSPFFLVWCEGGGPPSVRHHTYVQAKKEAQRLARSMPGLRFTVLVAVQGFEVMDLREVTYLGTDSSLDDEIPF